MRLRVKERSGIELPQQKVGGSGKKKEVKKEEREKSESPKQSQTSCAM